MKWTSRDIKIAASETEAQWLEQQGCVENKIADNDSWDRDSQPDDEDDEVVDKIALQRTRQLTIAIEEPVSQLPSKLQQCKLREWYVHQRETTGESTLLGAGERRLADYIVDAERRILGTTRSDTEVFRPQNGGLGPILRPNRPNRILILKGCFNPPHRAHRELLLHTFLGTNDETIAAMIVCVSDRSIRAKAHADTVLFTKEQRSRLWEDKAVQTFAWVYPGDSSNRHDFMYVLAKNAREDGFELIFESLLGAEYLPAIVPSRSAVFCDLTRPVEGLRSSHECPQRVPGLSNWSHVNYEDLPQHCWPCKKAVDMWPGLLTQAEDAGMERREKDDLLDILNRCHHETGRGMRWIAKLERNEEIFVSFISSGRTYPEDKSLPEMSSTMIRKHLLDFVTTSEATSPTEHVQRGKSTFANSPWPRWGYKEDDFNALQERLRPLVVDPEKLLMYIAQNMDL